MLHDLARHGADLGVSKMVVGGMPFPMLPDGGGKIGTVYGVYDEAAGVDIRGRFMIDPGFVGRAMEVLARRSAGTPRNWCDKIGRSCMFAPPAK